jgi:GNAT superfamily N-acetyltransferase
LDRDVRRATAADLAALAPMLARAFDDDPVANWAAPGEAPRAWMLERFHGARLRQLLPHGEVWMNADGESAALWAPPGHWKTSAREDLGLARAMSHRRLLRRAPLVGVGLLGVERRHPAEPPHWYLATLGTEPARQGRGLGTAALAPVLEECDRDGIGAYLECSKERNIDYYARFGFRATGAVRLPRGPTLWPMWRDPVGSP